MTREELLADLRRMGVVPPSSWTDEDLARLHAELVEADRIVPREPQRGASPRG